MAEFKGTHVVLISARKLHSLGWNLLCKSLTSRAGCFIASLPNNFALKLNVLITLLTSNLTTLMGLLCFASTVKVIYGEKDGKKEEKKFARQFLRLQLWSFNDHPARTFNREGGKRERKIYERRARSTPQWVRKFVKKEEEKSELICLISPAAFRQYFAANRVDYRSPPPHDCLVCRRERRSPFPSSSDDAKQFLIQLIVEHISVKHRGNRKSIMEINFTTTRASPAAVSD